MTWLACLLGDIAGCGRGASARVEEDGRPCFVNDQQYAVIARRAPATADPVLNFVGRN